MRPSPPAGGDLLAGVSVALIAVPQSLAYAELAGMPAHHGLIAAGLPSVLAAFFVSSRQLQTGPVALTALLTFGSLAPLATEAAEEWVALAALLALLVGAIRISLGLLRMGRVAFLLSEPVLLGFTNGAAVLILSSQLPRALGDTSGRDENVMLRAVKSLLSPGAWGATSLAYAAGAVIIIVVGRRIHRLFPGVLVAVVGAIIVSLLTGFDGPAVGELPSPVPSISLDLPWSSFGELVVPAIAIALVGFAEPASIARTFAAIDRTAWNSDREMISQGVANLTSGLLGGFPVGGSFSRSSLNRLAGAESPWAGAISGVCVLAAIPVIGALEPLPSSVLGAIVIVAVAKLIRPRQLWVMARQSGAQGVVAIGALAATIISAPRVERGVLIGVGLSIGAHLYRELNVKVESSLDGRHLTIAPKGVLWFATVPAVDRLLRVTLAEHTEVDSVIIDLTGVGRLDYSGASALARVCDEYRAAGITVDCVSVPPGAKRSFDIHFGPHSDAADI